MSSILTKRKNFQTFITFLVKFTQVVSFVLFPLKGLTKDSSNYVHERINAIIVETYSNVTTVQGTY